MSRTRVLLALLVLVGARPAAGEIAVRVHVDRPRTTAGDSVDLAVQISGAQNTPVPAIPPIDGLSVRYVGPSTQVSLVNGQMTASVTHHFSVTPLRAGVFTIGPLAVEVDGRRYEGGSVTLQADAPGTGGAAPNPQLRLVLSAERSEVYLHERLPITLKLLVGNVQVADLQYPTVPGDGFALDKLPEPEQRQERTADGAFQVVEFRAPLTPLRSGALSVGPARMGLNVIERRRGGDRFFDQFFADPFGQRRPRELLSEPLALTVLPLPEAGRPADFSGAVGRFELDVRAAPLALQVGDPVTLTLTIRGVGTLESVTAPALAAGDAFRFYPPQAGKPTEGTGNGDQKVFEQVVIPQRPGALALPEIRFSYFDPEARTYRTVTHPPIPLEVRPAAGPSATPQIVGGRPAAPAPEPLGRDIVTIKDAPGRLVPRGARRTRSALFWAWQPVPLLVWFGVLLHARRRRRLVGDLRYARFTRAGREARRALAQARAALRTGDRAAAYDRLAGAVRDYLAAKLDLPPGGVTPEAVGERLRAAGAAARMADDLRDFLAACEQARFAPTTATDGDALPTLARADAIIRACERERRLGRAVVALLVTCALAGVAAATATESPATLFFRGNVLYADGRFADAAAAYEQILAGGRESGAVYYNLGNARFRAGDPGQAVLNYERARRLMPRDPDLLANLRFARSGAPEGNDTPAWARLVFPLAGRMTSDGLLLLASAAYTALMAILVLGLLVPAALRASRPAVLAAALVLAVALSSAVYRLITVDLPVRAVVVTNTPATVRFEPAPGGTVHFTAPTGSLLRILGEREGWLQVARADGQRGWVERTALAPL